jgi:hypothetical protein
MNKVKIVIAALLLIVSIPAAVWAQFTETKSVNRRFKVSPETRIEIANKYGKIKINTWNKDSVILDIKVRVEDKKLSKLEKTISGIDFDITNNSHFLIVRTKVGETSSNLEKEVQNLKETLMLTDSKIEIDYTIWIPASNQLKVENKFGDIFIDDYSGEIEISLSNGNLKSHNFEGKAKLTLSFADATINQVKTAQFNCNYSDVYLKKAEKLIIVSKSTEFDIVEVSDLDIDSRRDKFRIQQNTKLVARSSFTNFRVSEITDYINIKAEYGDVDIQKVGPEFRTVYLESKSTDINLGFSETSEFGFEITGTKTQTGFTPGMDIKKTETLDEKEKKVKVTGNFGKNLKTAKLTINAVSGSVNINEY